jgi:integrase
MRVRLKGVKTVKKRLADGRVVRYWYAWRGGPRLKGEPGWPEFVASYNAAVAQFPKAQEGILDSVIDKFQDSEAFLSLAPRTQSDYRKLLRAISAEFGDFPLAALPGRKSRGAFLEWRDSLARRSRRQADYAWSVLARVLSWALDRGLVEANPCEKGGRLYSASRSECVWSDEDEAAFMRAASEPLRLAMVLALWTGQRQGDLLRLPWSAYDGKTITLKQSKTGARVAIPVGAPLKSALDATKKRGPLILMNTRGRVWSANGFHASWRKACLAAGVSGVTFHDLRGTSVLRLFLAGATEAEVATITGHSLRDVRSILDANYFCRDPELARSAITKLEIARAKKEGGK